MNTPVADTPTDSDPRWLTTGVVGVSAASLCSDTGHEITTAVLPAFLTATLHTGPAVLGVIESVSDALMGLAKLAGGAPADQPATRARLARGGYLATAALGGAIGLTVAVWQVAILRAGSWIARGLRSPARDALLAAITPAAARGRAFGLERAGDNLGAVAGPLLAAALVASIGVRATLLVAAIPGVAAVVAISVAASQARRDLTPAGRTRLRLRLAPLRGHGLARICGSAALFEAGNIATTLLILRATTLLRHDHSATAAATIAILLYTGHNAAAAVVSLAGGARADRGQARLTFAAGAGCYLLAYLGFAVGAHTWLVLLGPFVLAGAGIGLAETAQSTMVAAALPDHLRGSGFGLLGLIQAGGDLTSTLIVGVLWATTSATIGFGYAAAWMATCLILLAAVRPSAKPPAAAASAD